MPALADKLYAARPPAIWIDDLAYTARLFGVAHGVWTQSAELAAYRRKAIGLLKSEINLFSLQAFLAAWLVESPALVESMKAKRRTTSPLRVLLADEGLRARAKDAATTLQLTLSSLPLVLTLDSPRHLLSKAYQWAFDSTPDVEADDVDGASVYVAEFLRTFDSVGVSAVLLDESTEESSLGVDPTLYQPIANIASHYRWDLGLRGAPENLTADSLQGFTFLIGSHLHGYPCGQGVSNSFWSGGTPPVIGDGHFAFADIAADAAPEAVLKQLSLLRSV